MTGKLSEKIEGEHQFDRTTRPQEKAGMFFVDAPQASQVYGSVAAMAPGGPGDTR